MRVFEIAYTVSGNVPEDIAQKIRDLIQARIARFKDQTEVDKTHWLVFTEKKCSTKTVRDFLMLDVKKQYPEYVSEVEYLILRLYRSNLRFYKCSIQKVIAWIDRYRVLIDSDR